MRVQNTLKRIPAETTSQESLAYKRMGAASSQVTMHRSRTWQNLKQRILLLFLPLLPQKEAKKHHRVTSTTAPEHPNHARCFSDENPTLFSAHGNQPLWRQPPKGLHAGPDFSTLTYFLQFCFLRKFSTYNRAAALTPFSLSNSW